MPGIAVDAGDGDVQYGYVLCPQGVCSLMEIYLILRTLAFSFTKGASEYPFHRVAVVTERMHRVLGMELTFHKVPKWAFFCTPRDAWRNWSFRNRNTSAHLSRDVTWCL